MEKRPRPFWIRLVRGCLIVYAAVCVYSCTMADRLIFMPQRPAYTREAPNLISLSTRKDEILPAFYFPARVGKPTILYSHGNAEDIGGSIELYQAWRRDGWGALAYDYPGYGHATGKPGEASSQRAIEATWHSLTDEHAIPPADIIIVGRSIGSGPSVWLADRHKAAALVLISPFTSSFAVRSPAQWIFPGNRFPNLKRIRQIDTPLLVIHGESDGIIPVSHGRTLHEASPAKTKRFVGLPEAGHNDLQTSEITGPIREFIAELRSDPH
ncbi:alpha/beta hydrolase [Haloferula chungangensis]|uniref:Alpha/beta hydrolase n=1 Tax=Haloferula chungangensis TaxID=1048331 RepID=A0ABW2L254_9BACT